MKRIILLGVDGLVLPLADHLADEGHLPHFARLRREGAVTSALPFVSTWGPINWMCFATGASPGTAWPGTVPVAAKGSSVYRAETLWEALARDGRSSLVISYPGAWPAATERALVMIPDRASTDLPPMELARPDRYMTAGLAERYQQPPGTRAGWIPLTQRARTPRDPLLLPTPGAPASWANLPVEPLLASAMPVRGLRGETLATFGLLVAPPGQPPEVRICLGTDAAKSLATLTPGRWSDWLRLDLAGQSGYTRLKLLELCDDRRELALCHTEIYPTSGFARPTGIEADLIANVGPYASGSSADLRPSDPFWQTAVEEAEYEADWLASAAECAASDQDWRLLMTVFRPPDAANHGCLAFIDPELPFYGGRDTALAFEILAGAYGAMDRALGRFMALADEDTIVALASDHGAAVNHITCDIYNLLVEHDLLAIVERNNRVEVDWSQTQAYIRPTRSGSEVFVNLRGREPHGIVPPDDYANMQRRIIDLLLDWREPETSQRAVALALSHRDSALLGYWGESAGDVQFIYNAGCVWGELPPGVSIARTAIPSVNHGPQIPTASRGLATNMGLFALWGPGIRRGYRRPVESLGPVRMCDPAPTLARLLSCPAPGDNEGAVLDDMLE